MTSKYLCIGFIFCFCLFSGIKINYAQNKDYNSHLIASFLEALPNNPDFDIHTLQHKYKLKLHYVQIDRDAKGFPSLTYHSFDAAPKTYFYPASLVKLPLLLFTLEKLNELKNFKIDKYSLYKTEQIYKCAGDYDTLNLGVEGYPCIANDIRKILLVSDNNAYNILFDYLGQYDIKKRLNAKGYNETKILRRMLACNVHENRSSNPFWFYDKQLNVLYEQPALFNEDTLWFKVNKSLIGKAYYENNKRINKPKDFSHSNYMSLEDATNMLIRLILPETVENDKRWHIHADDRAFLLKHLCMLPRESTYQEYKDYNKYHDSFKKFFIYGDTKDSITDKNIKIFNVVGYSYGFVSDLAYVVDFEHGVEFFLAASLYANKSNIIDGKYNYDDIGFPFLGALGRIVLNYEISRKKTFLSDFKELKQFIE